MLWVFTSSVQALEISPIDTKPLTIVVPQWGFSGDPQNSYFVGLLALAFAKTEAIDGVVEIRAFSENLTGARFMADLKNNITVDVAWNGTSKQREEDYLTIRIPLLKSLSEYRVLLIRREDQEKFSAVHSLDDLKEFTAGGGADWPSTELLRYNKLPIVTASKSSLLIGMLKAKRFDYMSRNLFEVWAEADLYKNDGLVVENSLLLSGGVPLYFFVNKSNKKLASRIERGLNMAISDGSFDALFLATPSFNMGIQELAKNNRTLLTLKKN
ncbi:MAG: transporter substrate-binding domain-containing protein [Gammaproteobacteria bacterium]|nr:transporter substrate-binding domain-containing protein [Gammaproteobacteria bacterium]